MRSLLRSPLGSESLALLLRVNLVAGLLIFCLLQIWRPCYFLTDDNLTGLFPIFTEMGRHLKTGHSPFVSNAIFGGHYDLSRDAGGLFWHPFYLLPVLLSDTFARFWIIDCIALLFLTLTLVGFTLLAHRLAREFNPNLPGIYVVFFTLSFVFSTYMLVIGPSWVVFLGSQSALPWLALGILDRHLVRGTILIAIFTIHQFFGGYLAMAFSSGLFLSFFALGLCLVRRSPRPFLAWILGNGCALLLTAPFLIHLLGGFAHSHRAEGLTLKQMSEYSIPAPLFVISLFIGNWSHLIIAAVAGPAATPAARQLGFPFTPTLLACAAAWCLLPALLLPQRWRPLEILCFVTAGLVAILVMRPLAISMIMHEIPYLKSMRWPFRESLQFLFFLHLFLLLRYQGKFVRIEAVAAGVGLLVFLLPLPWSRVPTLNAFVLDRQLLFSGEADAYWARLRTRLQPNDDVATVINWEAWKKRIPVPFTLLDTANFAALSHIRSISGYAPAAPSDQVPLKTVPWYLFGAFRESQIPDLLREKPDLKLISLEGVSPLRIYLYSNGQKIDLASDLPKTVR